MGKKERSAENLQQMSYHTPCHVKTTGIDCLVYKSVDEMDATFKGGPMFVSYSCTCTKL